ncbi:MAG: transglutaminase domain protein, partial [Chloroflexi bacterium]|nr:transglutaminase domain protein [Chloroflexota bacterium]
QSWQMAGSIPYAIPANTFAPADVPRHLSHQLTVTVQVVQPADGLLFAPGRPVWSNLAMRGTYSPVGSGNEPTTLYDAAPLTSGSTYRITAELPYSEPRPAANGPPADSFFGLLPSDLDPRIATLAASLTRGAPSAYAAAKNIETYLRSGRFTYDTEVGAAPGGANPISYFLFDSRRGYCVHFASAMALLARAAGLPSRVVGGYVTGQLVNGSWEVAGKDAHTWPEIFFAGTGWVPFEPTSGFAPASQGQHRAVTQPAPSAIPTVRQAPVPIPTTAAPGIHRQSPGQHGALPLLFGLLAIVVAVAGVGIMLLRREVRTIGGVYRSMCRAARWLAVRPLPSQTPNEFAQAFAERSAAEYQDVSRITALYVAARYGDRAATAEDVQDAATTLRRLRRRWLAHRFGLK